MAAIDPLLCVFARSIMVKAQALKTLELTPNQRRRLRVTISLEIKACGAVLYPDIRPLEVNEAALAEATRLGVAISTKAWKDQHRFDRGRKLFHWEHVNPVSCVQAKCEAAESEEAIVAILKSRLRIAWILKREDRELTRLGFRSKRPDPDGAYRAAGIVLHQAFPG